MALLTMKAERPKLADGWNMHLEPIINDTFGIDGDLTETVVDPKWTFLCSCGVTHTASDVKNSTSQPTYDRWCEDCDELHENWPDGPRVCIWCGDAVTPKTIQRPCIPPVTGFQATLHGPTEHGWATWVTRDLEVIQNILDTGLVDSSLLGEPIEQVFEA